ncbi:MAG TPA: glycoside hydrolase family 2 TIM barrel-domain containing protein, partial [Candidatus Omnitrophota bacterium]|nr:glycoside hydrolase family 2 TIM barrel-domain containing protein [Candidatus Omnitrophota bacterium]
MATISQEFYKWYKADLSLMSRMGVNVARVYYDFGTGPEALEILDAFYRMGIKLIMAVDSPRYGVAADMDNVRKVVEAYKNHPAILMWAVGNEWDLNYYYGKFSSGLDAADFTERAAQLIKSIDGNHPVSTIFADPHIPAVHVLSPEEFPVEDNGYAYTVDIVNTFIPSVDVWGLSIYRGTSMEDVFQQWRSISDKPMFVAEFGADSFDHRILGENQAMQAEVNGWIWDEIFFDLAAERTEGTAIGGLVFELRDEWWKSGSPNHHDTSWEANSGQPDGYNDEEYFGVADIYGNPKETFNALKDRFTKGQAAVTLNERPLLRATSYGDASFGIGEKTVYFRGGGGGGG